LNGGWMDTVWMESSYCRLSNMVSCQLYQWSPAAPQDPKAAEPLLAAPTSFFPSSFFLSKKSSLSIVTSIPSAKFLCACASPIYVNCGLT